MGNAILCTEGEEAMKEGYLSAVSQSPSMRPEESADSHCRKRGLHLSHGHGHGQVANAENVTSSIVVRKQQPLPVVGDSTMKVKKSPIRSPRFRSKCSADDNTGHSSSERLRHRTMASHPIERDNNITDGDMEAGHITSELIGTGETLICSEQVASVVAPSPMPTSILSPRRRRTHNRFLVHLRKNSCRVIHRTGHTMAQLIKALEEFFYPKNPLIMEDQYATTKSRKLRPVPVMIEGCDTLEQHYDRIEKSCTMIQSLQGEEGLRSLGFEYRMIPCEAHQQEEHDPFESDLDDDSNDEFVSGNFAPRRSASQPSLAFSTEITSSLRSNASSSIQDLDISPPTENVAPLCSEESDQPCLWCMRHLFHVESNQIVHGEVRSKFIADGDMYEGVSRLSQEYAQVLMCQEGDLVWHTIEEFSQHCRKEPIRVLVSRDHPIVTNEASDKPTLIIATGRGKVRAGIFSRQHLLCSGLESSTAIPMIREAMTRDMFLLILDPNVHGDEHGFVTFQKSMDHCLEKCDGSLYMLSHSASGGHFARYLLDRSKDILTRIHAVAFTDSTHNIQWARTKKNSYTKRGNGVKNISKVDDPPSDDDERFPLYQMLESDRCVYFRCNIIRQDGSNWHLHPAGEPVQTDAFWKHRFGNIRTMWAGTDEHSMTNWYAHSKIWEHFDGFLEQERGRTISV